MVVLHQLSKAYTMHSRNTTPLNRSWIKLTLLVYFMCSGACQLGPWTDWSICQCAIVGTEGFTARFRKPVPGSGMAYKCHLEDKECTQFEPCSCYTEKYTDEIKGDDSKNTSQILADYGSPNESVAYSFLDRMRKKRNAFYNNYYYNYKNEDYGNDNYQGHTNSGPQFGSYQGNKNVIQPWNVGKSNPWDGSRQYSHRNTYFDYNEYYGYGNRRDYDVMDTGYTTADDNYYDQYQYGASNRNYGAKSYAYRTNGHMKHTGTSWNGVQGSNGGRGGYDGHRLMGSYNYRNDQSYDGYRQTPNLHYPRDNAYYGYESNAYVAQDIDYEDIPAQTVVKLQYSQQQILDEIRKLNERLQQSKDVMAHFTDEIQQLEQLEAARQESSLSK